MSEGPTPMSIPRTRALLPLVLSPLLAACTESTAPPSSAQAPSLTNLGLAVPAAEIAVDGDLMLVGASELAAGARDLDQDGDAFDLVAFLVDLRGGGSRNTGLALDADPARRVLRARGELALFAASEAGSGRRDLNGDGDASDSVLFVLDRRDATTRNLGLALAGGAAALGGPWAAFAVSEADQGRDLDGDGSLAGTVLHAWNADTRALRNTGLSASAALFVEGGNVAFFAAETSVDLNDDGDLLDAFVLQVYDLTTDTLRSSGLATDGAAPVYAGGAWLVAVPEAGQGLDLDDDGELQSTVPVAFLPATGEVRSLGLACVDVPCAVAAPESGRPAFVLRADERQVGDRNGDGDALDLVPQVYDPVRDRLLNTGVASVGPLVFGGGVLGFLADEAAQGADLNGDGDRFDTVPFRASLLTGAAVSLGVEAIDLRGSDDFLLLARRESEAGEDWNLDGDRLDVVVHVFDPRTRVTVDTRLASTDVFGADAGGVLLYVDEAGQGADLNADGDRSDQVFVRFDLAQQAARTSGLAGGLDQARFGHLSPSNRQAFLANEAAQRRDLDGDGDLDDDVLFLER